MLPSAQGYLLGARGTEVALTAIKGARWLVFLLLVGGMLLSGKKAAGLAAGLLGR